MKTLAIDIETFSSADLRKTGVYRYTEAPDFYVMLFAWSEDGGPVQCLNLLSEALPVEIHAALQDPDVLKTAFNANFERTCLAQHFGLELPPEQWSCTMAKAAQLGLPLSLDAVAKALGIDAQKDNEGKALIRYFSVPCRVTKANGGRTRNMPEDAPEKWEAFVRYCIQDVVVEQAVRKAIEFFPIPEAESRLWALDQRINDKGVLADVLFTLSALSQDKIYKDRMIAEAISITDLANPNSGPQLKAWLEAAMGEEVTSLTKTAVPELLEKADSPEVKRVLAIRQELSKTSTKKYVAIKNAVCEDSRVRGLFQYYGASRTGRWAGRLVQLQNLPRSEDGFDHDLARKLVTHPDPLLLEICFGNVPDTLSQLIRTTFVAPEGHQLLVADYSAIEARVIAWLAGERWRMEVFGGHGAIYEASASQMFKVSIETISYKDANGIKVKGPNYDLRQKGKVAELALGYGGGPNALVAMGALKMGIAEKELPALVAMWRNANKRIIALWQILERAAIAAVQGEPSTVRGLRFFCKNGFLFIRLPSGRHLAYQKPRIAANRFGNSGLVYMGLSQTTKQWSPQETYGGKLVENVVQAIARDCLAVSMLRLDAAGYNLTMHVHDEIVAEEPVGGRSLEEMCRLMSEPMSWAPELPLRADGYATAYYKKD